MAAVQPKIENQVFVASPALWKRQKKEKLFRRKSFVHCQETEQVKCEPQEKFTSHKRKRQTNYEFCDKSSTMLRAEEVEKNLAHEFPSMIKLMLPSHVTGGFWLGLAKKFCELHLPKNDALIILEDESGKEYKTKYIWHKAGLSAGWRGFSIVHNLVEGDVLVFQLVRPTKFKVYIVRFNGSDEMDGALGNLKAEACMKKMASNEDIGICVKTEKCLEPLSENISQGSIQKNNLMVCETKFGDKFDQSENDSEELFSEVLDGIKLSDSVVDFAEVRSVDNFNIHVNGLIINSEFPQHMRTKYYELCNSQKSYLHTHLLEGLNCGLTVGMIAETINIADAIRNSKHTTPQNLLVTWDKTLKAFEDLGMNVSFLRARIDRLVSLAVKAKRKEDAKLERVQVKEEMRTLVSKLLESNKVLNRLDTEIENLDVDTEILEHMFQEVANAPW